jgi:hypothetical protein
MTRTRKNRYAEQMKNMETIAQERPQTSSVISIFKSDPESTPELIEYALERAWKGARAALKVDDSSPDLRIIFEKFRLDPDDPWSWRMMASYMHILFSLPKRKRGRPVEHTPEVLIQLLAERESPALKNLPDSKAANRLAKTRAGSTRKSGVEGLRKQIRKARLVGTK